MEPTKIDQDQSIQLATTMPRSQNMCAEFTLALRHIPRKMRGTTLFSIISKYIDITNSFNITYVRIGILCASRYMDILIKLSCFGYTILET